MTDLTPRMVQVLRLVACGLQDKEVARELGIAEGTAKFYMQQIYIRLEAKHRANAVFKAVQMGLLECEPH